MNISIEDIKWFTPNIVAADRAVSPLRDVVISNRPSLDMKFPPVKLELFIPPKSQKVSSEDIIDTFLGKSGLRIIASEQGEDIEVETSVEFDQEDDLVSESLAKIYLSQGLNDMAIDIYTRLSLLNSEKSSYFAELIDNIKQNKLK
ncbi:MAG: hypothetical protein SNJ33_04920 [Rikenellaceae bacterium]